MLWSIQVLYHLLQNYKAYRSVVFIRIKCWVVNLVVVHCCEQTAPHQIWCVALCFVVLHSDEQLSDLDKGYSWF